jgi:hypothetical protein
MNAFISEQQFDMLKKLICNESITLDNGDTKEFGDTSKVSTSATITDADGEPKPGKDVYADEITKFQANNDWRGTIRNRIG